VKVLQLILPYSLPLLILCLPTLAHRLPLQEQHSPVSQIHYLDLHLWARSLAQMQLLSMAELIPNLLLVGQLDSLLGLLWMAFLAQHLTTGNPALATVSYNQPSHSYLLNNKLLLPVAHPAQPPLALV
jgi:hypothetical protein